MKRALLPILLILLAIGLLIAFSYWYEQRWGIEGPFPCEHHH
jgi:hypothetical protein